jgi:hypothetical protein
MAMTLQNSLEFVESRSHRPDMLQSGEGIFHQMPIAIQPLVQICVQKRREHDLRWLNVGVDKY